MSNYAKSSSLEYVRCTLIREQVMSLIEPFSEQSFELKKDMSSQRASIRDFNYTVKMTNEQLRQLKGRMEKLEEQKKTNLTF